jgi:hypothetical protein
MAKDRLTSVGLAVAAFGWVVLGADALLTPYLVGGGNLAAVTALRSDVFSVAETTVVSGFALAIMGTLRSGFGSLNRFFESVLDRANAPRPAAAASAHAEAPTVTIEPEVIEPAVEPAPRPAAGPAKPRNYVILANGAVEVETLLGTRIFASLDEARDFIR